MEGSTKMSTTINTIPDTKHMKPIKVTSYSGPQRDDDSSPQRLQLTQMSSGKGVNFNNIHLSREQAKLLKLDLEYWLGS